MHGFTELSSYRSRRRQSARRRFRGGHRAAALRALTGARLLAGGAVPSLEAAAVCCGSSVPYIQAMVVLLKSENVSLLDQVLTGDVPVLAAAKQVKRLAALVSAYRCADGRDRVAFMRTCGAEGILNELAEAAS
jgi:hypothetical protein